MAKHRTYGIEFKRRVSRRASPLMGVSIIPT